MVILGIQDKGSMKDKSKPFPLTADENVTRQMEKDAIYDLAVDALIRSFITPIFYKNLLAIDLYMHIFKYYCIEKRAFFFEI